MTIHRIDVKQDDHVILKAPEGKELRKRVIIEIGGGISLDEPPPPITGTIKSLEPKDVFGKKAR